MVPGIFGTRGLWIIGSSYILLSSEQEHISRINLKKKFYFLKRNVTNQTMLLIWTCLTSLWDMTLIKTVLNLNIFSFFQVCPNPKQMMKIVLQQKTTRKKKLIFGDQFFSTLSRRSPHVLRVKPQR